MRRIFVPLFVVLIILTLSISVFAQSKSREELLGEIEAKRAELATLEKQFLAPSEVDRAAFAEFLHQPDTGLTRLLPREIYDSAVYKENNKTLTIRGGGAYYSFGRRTHEYGYGSDIELQSRNLSVGFAGADYGMLLNIGNVALEEITLEHPSLRFLSEYKVPSAEPEARSEARRFGAGTVIDGIHYSSRLPVEVNTTYLLRSINYRESDVLVVLRAVRRDTDGSLIIAWKLLRKYPVPELVSNKP